MFGVCFENPLLAIGLVLIILTDKVAILRYTLLKRLLGPIRSFLDDPMLYMDPCCVWHMQAEGPGADRTVVLETLQHLCISCGLFPLLEPHDWYLPVAQLQDWLESLENDMTKAATQFTLKCSDCQPYQGLFDSIRNVQGRHPLIRLSESQKTHLARKRKESGIPAHKL